ncbi:MoxR family ATPase [Alteromonas aestuariivivens]|uniref:MoxR family ATPase n=1 Tax=Alteromonas aestuariivivens TaxID=1938339 RepID=A0A3D8MBB4_9ALTE|nr:MoxR family ATPase [Alteromonas aestuariivivens]RDV27562.1 MoxR family ATPase [Alteromonas aestuariivivens]
MRAEFQPVVNALSQHIIGKQQQIKLALTCLLANGHLLIEDLPGMGKTTLSHSLARAFGMDFSRIQFTSDLLPSDMLGVNIYNTQQNAFQFRPGPVFSQLVLADEINRASPKTQSALLEAMEEQQVSIDGVTHPLPQPFFVIGTQNPSHQAGTYPLPESQLDRFLMRISLGYPSWEAEKAMLEASSIRRNPDIETCVETQSLVTMQDAVNKVHCSDAVINYILKLVALSRDDIGYPNPLSPRASKALMQASKAWAYLHDRPYVVPEDVQAVFVSVAEHRLRSQQDERNQDSILSRRLLESVDPLAA